MNNRISITFNDEWFSADPLAVCSFCGQRAERPSRLLKLPPWNTERQQQICESCSELIATIFEAQRRETEVNDRETAKDSAEWLHEKVEGMLGVLPPVERRIIELRHGLENGVRSTVDEVARTLRLCPEEAKRLQAEAEDTLKAHAGDPCR